MKDPDVNVAGSYYRSKQHVQQPSYRTGKFNCFLSKNATRKPWQLDQQLIKRLSITLVLAHKTKGTLAATMELFIIWHIASAFNLAQR